MTYRQMTTKGLERLEELLWRNRTSTGRKRLRSIQNELARRKRRGAALQPSEAVAS